jgi:hypothetical protein
MEELYQRVLNVLVSTSPERPLSAAQIAERAGCTEGEAERAIWVAQRTAKITWTRYFHIGPYGESPNGA